MSKIAVIKTGGKQYKVKVGDELTVEKLDPEKGKKIDLPDLLSGKKVKITIIEQLKGPKIRILKFKNKTRYTRRMGHRQPYTKIKIESIT